MHRERRYLRSTTRLRFTGAQPWLFLRRCTEAGIILTDAEAEDELTCLVSIPGRELPRAEKIAAQCGCTLEVLREMGLSRLERRVRGRGVLCALLALLFAALWAASLFVWDIRVTENDSDLPDSEIMRALSEQGVGVGAFWPAFRGERIRTRALLALPELSWLAVNVQGSRAMVEVRAALPPPDIFDPGRGAEIIAEHAGVIESIHVLSGSPQVSRGDAVTAGQTLIAGTELSPHARGTVNAYTYYELTAAAPLQREKKTPAGRPIHRFALICGQRRINFYADSGILPMNCDRITREWVFAASGAFALPLRLLEETCQPYTLETVSVPGEDVRTELETALREDLERRLSDTGEVRAIHYAASDDGAVMTVTLRSECLEEIGMDTVSTQ